MTTPEQDYDEATLYHIPKQRKRTIKDMGASLSVYPPLGQVTQVQQEHVRLTALLEVPAGEADQPWEVSLWHSAGDDVWKETTLSATDRIPSTLQPLDGSTARLWFEAEVPVQPLLNFTVKFRSQPDQLWKWIRDEQGLDDGTIIVTSNLTVEALPDDFGAILKGFGAEVKVESCQSQCPATRLWEMAVPVAAANGEDSTFADVRLGLPWGGFLR